MRLISHANYVLQTGIDLYGIENDNDSKEVKDIKVLWLLQQYDQR